MPAIVAPIFRLSSLNILRAVARAAVRIGAAGCIGFVKRLARFTRFP